MSADNDLFGQRIEDSSEKVVPNENDEKFFSTAVGCRENVYDDEKLIKLVEKHEILYNNCFGYKDAQLKSDSWVKIGEELGVNSEECARRWKHLRGRYSRELKQVKTNANFEVGWHLFGALSFLRKFVKQKSTRIYEVNDELLINLVRNHQVLYRKKGLGLRQTKSESWLEISEEMGITADECYGRWKYLRRRYSRELKQAEMLSETDASLCVQWPLYNSLSFLSDSIKHRDERYSMDSVKHSTKVGRKRKRLKHVCAEDSETSGTCYYDDDLFSLTIKDSTEKVVPNENDEKFFSTSVSCRENMTMVNTRSINLFGQTVAAIISEMSQAKQAKAMRVLFNTLIALKTEREES